MQGGFSGGGLSVQTVREGPDVKSNAAVESRSRWVSQPVSRVLSWIIIHLNRKSPSGLKQPTRKRRGPRHSFPIWSCSGWGLPCHRCCHRRGALLPHHFTLTDPPEADLGGLFSVALSVGSRPPGVTWHPALRSPDFPPVPAGTSDYPADLARIINQADPNIYRIQPRLVYSRHRIKMPLQSI